MTATDELCRLLDERGADYIENDFGITWSYYSDPHTATESMDGTLIVTGLTPAQAIAATLGESMTNTEKAALERRIDELCQEVEQGKAEFKKMDAWHSQELKAAMDENAKLRELVDELYPLADYGAMDASELDRAHDLMRELRIEVDK